MPGPEAERALVVAAKERHGEACERLIDAFTPLVASYARHYRTSPHVEHSELMQQGVVGLLRALERFDTGRETPFWAYAGWWVREAMQELFSDLARPVVLSDRAERQLARINGARRTHLRDRGRDASLTEIAASTGLSLPQVTSLVAAGRPSRSLDEPVPAHGADARVGDQIADPSAEEAFDAGPSPMDVSMLRPLLQVLCARDRRVVKGRFAIDGPERTLRELGAELGISAERVRQIEVRALDRLYQEVEGGTWQRPAPGLDAGGTGPTSADARTEERRAGRDVEHRRSSVTTMLEPAPPRLRDVHRRLGVETGPSPFVPPVDVVVSNHGVSIRMDVPGVGRDRLDIHLENDVLTIRGERPYPYPTDDAERVVRRVERGFGRFERSIRLPRELDAEAIDASLHAGVLTLRIPRPASQKSQRIEIKEGAVADEAGGSPELATAGSKS